VEETYIRRAIALACENVAAGGGPFGAVIVRGGAVLAEGVNRVTALCDATAHAEVSAIRAAGRALATHDLSGCTIFASCEPCPMCLGAILWARLDRVVYAASQADAAAAGFDDAAFCAELSKPPAARRTPVEQALAAEGLAPLLAWRQFSAKVPY
jgi:guanine deaminase